MKKNALLLLILAFFGCAAAHAFVDETNNLPIQLEKYKMGYFMFGNLGGYDTTKMQISMKTPVIKGWALYFAYSQVMFWQLWLDSQPFYDLNYDPEFFYRLNFGDEGDDERITLDIGLIENESNRVSGTGSRAWNRSYIRFAQTWAPWGYNAARFYVNFKLWIPYFVDKTNVDIAHYRGIYEIYATWADFMRSDWFPESDLTLRLYGGGPWFINPIDGAMELTWRFKTGWFKNTIAMTYLQFFWGHAENLRDYNGPPVFKFRWGVGF